jgi:ABC-2 type transport system permease protein
MSSQTPAGVIHDIGYKPYAGPRNGRAYIVRSLFSHSLRSAFGLGRGAKARIVPGAVFAIMLLPSLISVAQTAADPSRNSTLIPYDRYAHTMSLPLIVFIAVAAPELVTRDLRFRTLPLYFSRPLRRADYPLAKLLALAAAIAVLEIVPLLVMFLGTIASAGSGGAVWAQTKQLLPGLVVTAGYAVVFSPLALLLASATKRRVLATGAIAILILATSAVSGVLEAVGTVQNPPTPSPTGITYRPIAREAALIDPLRLVEGTRVWAEDASDPAVPPPGPLGPLYALELVGLIAVTGGGLVLRYRKVYAA